MVRGSRGRVTSSLALLVLALLFVATSGAAGDTDTATGLTYDVQNATRFRETFGLRADAQYVQQSVSDHERFSDISYGVPLTPAEARDLSERRNVAESTQPALDYAVAQPEYAGMYFDQLNGGQQIGRAHV